MKNKITIIMLVCLLMLVFNFEALAFRDLIDDFFVEDKTGLTQLYFGGNLNPMPSDEFEEYIPGAFGGLRIWVGNEIAVGVEAEHLLIDEVTDEAATTGYLGTVALEIEENINFITSGGYYTNGDNSSLGVKPGIEAKLIGDSISLMARGTYRMLDLDDLDYNGLEFAGGLMFSF